jgi:hypothetical protein
MGDDERDPAPESDAAIEREIRRERGYTLDAALGRMAGAGMMKGESPATRQRQAVAAIGEALARHLGDAEGALSAVLRRQVGEGHALLAALDRPMEALAGHVRAVLANDYALAELVREADREWGRLYDERPRFESPGVPPRPDDPYTLANVREALARLLAALEV